MGVFAADLDRDLDLDLFITHLKNESNTLFENLGNEIGFEDATAKSNLGHAQHSVHRLRNRGGRLRAGRRSRRVRGERASAPQRSPIAGCVLPAPWCSLRRAELRVRERRPREVPSACAAEERDRSRRTSKSTRGTSAGTSTPTATWTWWSRTSCRARASTETTRRGRGIGLSVRARDPKLQARRDRCDGHGPRRGDRSCCARSPQRGSYLSSSEAIAHFGLGEATKIDSIVVRWPGGTSETFAGGAVDRRMELLRGQGTKKP